MARQELGPANILTRITAFCLVVGFYLACTSKDEVTSPSTAALGPDGQARIMASPSSVQPSPSNIRPSPSDIRSSPSDIRPSPSDIRPSPSNIQPSPSPIGGPAPGPSATPSGTPSGSPTPGPTPTPTPVSPTKHTFTSSTPVVVTAGSDTVTSSPISVTGLTGSISWAVVSLYVTTTDASLIRYIYLNLPASPGVVGVTPHLVTLFSGADLGVGCSVGSASTWDPFSTRSVTTGVSPYSGTFQSFQGAPNLLFGPILASALAGNWTLDVTQGLSIPLANATTINCWHVDVYTIP